jgi:membrane protein implicated in regulation of membrane protease activity
MNGRQFSFGRSGNPLVQILSLLVFGVLAIGAIVMGAFVLLAFLGVAFVGFAVLAVRGWWWGRKLKARGGASESGATRPSGESAHGTRLIEAEYVVVNEDDDDRDSRGQR